MAASTDPTSYPAALQMLIEHFKDPEAPVVTTYFERAESAARFRFVFYNFKKALKKAGMESDVRMANGIIVKLSPTDAHGGATLEFSLRDNADYALDLEAAIMRAKEGHARVGIDLSTTPDRTVHSHLRVGEPPAAGRESSTNTQGTHDSHDALIDGFMQRGTRNEAGKGSE